MLSRVFITIYTVVIFSTSCSKEKPMEVYRLPEHAVRLLAGDTGKVWKLAARFNNGTRVNMGECTLLYRQTFLPDHSVRDNNSDMYDCGESMTGTWEFMENEDGSAFVGITSDMIPIYFKVPEGSKTKYFRLLELTEGSFIYQFGHQLFSNKTTVVRDILVPQDSVVRNRDFHW